MSPVLEARVKAAVRRQWLQARVKAVVRRQWCDASGWLQARVKAVAQWLKAVA